MCASHRACAALGNAQEFGNNWWEIDPSVMLPEEEPVVLLPEGDVVLPVDVGCRDSLARPDTYPALARVPTVPVDVGCRDSWARPDTDPALAWVPTVLLVGSLMTTSKSADTLTKSLGDHAHVHMAWCSPLLHTDNVLGYIHEAVATAVPSIVVCTGVLCYGSGAAHVHYPLPWLCAHSTRLVCHPALCTLVACALRRGALDRLSRGAARPSEAVGRRPALHPVCGDGHHQRSHVVTTCVKNICIQDEVQRGVAGKPARQRQAVRVCTCWCFLSRSFFVLFHFFFRLLSVVFF